MNYRTGGSGIGSCANHHLTWAQRDAGAGGGVWRWKSVSNALSLVLRPRVGTKQLSLRRCIKLPMGSKKVPMSERERERGKPRERRAPVQSRGGGRGLEARERERDGLMHIFEGITFRRMTPTVRSEPNVFRNPLRRLAYTCRCKVRKALKREGS